MLYPITEEHTRGRTARVLTLAVVFVAASILLSGHLSAAPLKQKSFPSPEDAGKALYNAAKQGKKAEMAAILGPGSRQVLSSGDKVEDGRMRNLFVRSYEEGARLEALGEDRSILRTGKDGWPFPLPIVRKGDAWRFDLKEGVEEILNRRIGRNELSAIQVCLAYVDAQKEYAMRENDKKGVLEYAEKFVSDPGRKNGLYWQAREGEEPSPMGPLFALAAGEGYALKGPKGKPLPYHGYLFRILRGQGTHARGGAYNYMAGDRMIGGFALLAYPAKYGNSGVMSFVVNQDGVVYQKDLGTDTEKTAAAVTVFDPDGSWTKAE